MAGPRAVHEGQWSAGTRSTTDPADTRLPAYLHGYRQGQLLCPRADGLGRVSTVIVDPGAATGGEPGDCTLADMSTANPDTQFYAYVDVAVMGPKAPDQGAFQNSCADPSEEGRTFTVQPRNLRVAVNDEGHAVYPDYDYLAVADLSAEYATACIKAIHELLSTPSAPGSTTSAEPVHFDGILLDDANMSPAHGQDMADLSPGGPWSHDAAYGRAMNETLVRIDDGVDTAMGRDIPVLINLGLDTMDPGQVIRATELARTGVVDRALREFTVAFGTGAPVDEHEMMQFLRVHRQHTEAGMPIVQHDYYVPLRAVPPRGYGQGQEVPDDSPCLELSAENTHEVIEAAARRRLLDHSMLLGHTLLTCTSTSAGLMATLSQAQTSCQTTAGTPRPLAERVENAYVPNGVAEIQELTTALKTDAFALGDPRITGGVWHQMLSDGQVVLVNTETSVESVVAYGRLYEIPGRSALIDTPT